MNKGLSGESTTLHNTRYEVRVFSLTQILKISLYFNGIFKTSHIGKTLYEIHVFLFGLPPQLLKENGFDFFFFYKGGLSGYRQPVRMFSPLPLVAPKTSLYK